MTPRKRANPQNKLSLTTWISKETLIRFQTAAERERRPISNLLWHIMELWLEEHHPDLKEMKDEWTRPQNPLDH